MKSKGRRSLVGSGAVLALVVAQAFVTLPAQAQRSTPSPGWRVSELVSVKGRFVAMADVDAASARDAWAVGLVVGEPDDQLLIEHWTGQSWRRAALPAKLTNGFEPNDDFFDTVVGATSPRDVWVFGGTGRYLRFIGGRWRTGRLPAPKTGVLVPQSVKVFGPDEVWVFGCQARSLVPEDSGCRPFAARFNGTIWHRRQLPGRGFLSQVSALSPDDIWAIRGAAQLAELSPGSHPQIVHWNGTTWRVASVQPTLPAGTQLSAITAISDSDLWIGGSAPNNKDGTYELVRHWNGRTWLSASPHAKPTRSQFFTEDLVPDGTGGLWELALDLSSSPGSLSRLRHLSHGHWLAPVDLRLALFKLAAIPGTDSTWGVGANSPITRGLIVLHGPRPR